MATKFKLKPSLLLSASPMASVDQRAEHEWHMMFILKILARTGDKFRKMTYEEYQKEGGKDTEGILEHFNRYVCSAETVVLYSPGFRKAAEYFEKNPPGSVKTDIKDIMDEQLRAIILDNAPGKHIQLTIKWSEEGKPVATIDVFQNDELKESFWGLPQAIEAYNKL